MIQNVFYPDRLEWMRSFYEVAASLGGCEIRLMQKGRTDLSWLESQFQFRLLLYYKPTETSSQSILLDGREYYRNPIFRSSRRLGQIQILSALHAYHIRMIPWVALHPSHLDRCGTFRGAHADKSSQRRLTNPSGILHHPQFR